MTAKKKDKNRTGAGLSGPEENARVSPAAFEMGYEAWELPLPSWRLPGPGGNTSRNRTLSHYRRWMSS